MRIARFALRSLNDIASIRSYRPIVTRTLSTNTAEESLESADDFERRIFGEHSGNDDRSSAFFQKLDRLEKEARDRQGARSGGSGFSFGGSMHMDGLDESFDALSDGMDGKLKKAAAYFEFDMDEVEQDNFAFRPDVRFGRGDTYTTRDLDLRKPGIQRARKEEEFEVTTEEVLRKADFRNVRFLANFITEAGIIIKRKHTGISAKAQRKIAREIKTARAFGLMPFTTMGTKAFVAGKTMENRDEDFGFETFEDDEDEKEPL